MKNFIRPEVLILTFAINIGLIATLIFTDAILVSDHKRTVIEWMLAILYIPQTFSFGAGIDFFFGKSHPGYLVALTMAFLFGLPASWLYSFFIFKLKFYFHKDKK